MSIQKVVNKNYILRPQQAAEAAGYSLPTFYRRKKDDPNFPRIVVLGHNARARGVYSLDWYKYLDQFREAQGGR
tara:strand:- start:820 stop:1041 length:222 start_codon:yes stop_codon:yes gene_type:complete